MGPLLYQLSPENVTVIFLGMLTVLLPGEFSGSRWILDSGRRAAIAGRYALLLLGLPYTLTAVMSGSFSPFLYFQF
jgi:hypothetical protein